MSYSTDSNDNKPSVQRNSDTFVATGIESDAKDAELTKQVIVESVIADVSCGDVVGLDVKPAKQVMDAEVVVESVRTKGEDGTTYVEPAEQGEDAKVVVEPVQADVNVVAMNVKPTKQETDADVVVEPVKAEGEVGGMDVDPTKQSGDAEAVKSVPEDMSGWMRNRRRRHLKKMRKNCSNN